MKKGLFCSILCLSISIFGAMTAYADEPVVITGGPASMGFTLQTAGVVTELPPEIVSAPGMDTGFVAMDGPAAGGPGVSGPAATGTQSQSGSELALDGLYVTPTYWRGDVYCAESCVSDGNGGWVYNKTDAYVPTMDKLYKLIREDGDWYVCEHYGRELWIRKSDSRLVSSINIETQDETRKNLVRMAISLLGKPYQAAGSGPDSFDCSGFINYCYSQIGKSVPRTSGDFGAMANISESELQPGDVLWRSGHVAMYIGNGTIIHSENSGSGVRAEALRSGDYSAFVNLLG